MLFGGMVELYRVEGSFGDAFGAVADGGDGGLVDESGEGSDAAGGAPVEVGGVAGEGAGFVVFEVEDVFDGDDGVGRDAVVTVLPRTPAETAHGCRPGESGIP